MLLRISYVTGHGIGYDALTITVDLVHVLLWNPTNYTLLNDARVSPADMLHNLQIFHSDLNYINHSVSWSICAL